MRCNVRFDLNQVLSAVRFDLDRLWQPKPLCSYSISKSLVSLLPSACRATALASPRRLDTNDLEMELIHSSQISMVEDLVLQCIMRLLILIDAKKPQLE